MTKYLSRRSLFAGACTLALLAAAPAYAAQFTVEVPSNSIAPGSEVAASVYLDTQGESINAMEGSLAIPRSVFDVISVRDGGSVVPIWIESPKVSDSNIAFSGITPGGYRGEHGFIFSVLLRAKTESSGTLSLASLQALKNDGSGSETKVTNVSAQVTISGKIQPSTAVKQFDTTLPEPFTIQVAQTPDAFDGKKFLVFTAQDKGSGMSHYEICEGLFASCVRGSSPYVLLRQSASDLISVRAVDVSGNVRVERLFTSGAVIRYSLYAILAILLGIGSVWLLGRRRA